MPASLTDRYGAASRTIGGACPIEAGVIGRLADHECRHGRLPFDHTAACGCWPQEGAAAATPPPANPAAGGRPRAQPRLPGARP